MKQRDGFSSYHPIVNFSYFLTVIVMSMFLLHPVTLLMSFFGAFLYAVYLGGKKTLRFFFCSLVPMTILIAALNPLFNHAGITILFYLGDNPVTAESIYYGFVAATMFLAVILWFSGFNEVMTSDKLMYLFGRVAPALSLVFSMVLRFVPRFKAQFKIISQAQRGIGRDMSHGRLLTRIKNGIRIMSIMITWALENAIDTADSMKSRGYGTSRRSAFSLFKFDSRDAIALVIIALLCAGCVLGAYFGTFSAEYFPKVLIKTPQGTGLICYACYLALCLLPMAVNVWEDAKWHCLESKI